MQQLSDSLKIVTQEDVELAMKPPVRTGEQNFGSGFDSANLMGLLGDIDGLRNEIHERMRRIEAVKQAKSVLQEDAERTEALNKRLAEIARVMTVAQGGIYPPGIEKANPEPVQKQSRESIAEVESGRAPVKVLNEVVALQWPTTEKPVDSCEEVQTEPTVELPEEISSGPVEAPVPVEASIAPEALLTPETGMGPESGFQRLEEVEQSRMQAWAKADEAAQEAKRLFERAQSRLNQAVSREEQADREFHAAREALTAAQQSLNARLEEAERRWKKTEEVLIEAKNVFDQSTAELTQARKKEESVTASLQSVRQEFMTAFESASQRQEEAERFWRRGDQAAKEAQQLIDQSTAELLTARKAEETAAADLLSARQELTTAYQFAAVAAQRRLDAVDSLRKATRWMVFAVALSWIATSWMGWFALHAKAPVWAPCFLTAILVVLAILVTKQGAGEV